MTQLLNDKNLFLDAQGPVVVNSSDPEVSIEQYRELQLFCVAKGLPVPTVEWFKVKKFN